MEIVNNPTLKKKEIGLDELSTRKATLKKQIALQKVQIGVSSKNFLGPISFTTVLFQAFGKGISLVDGVLIGYKIVRTFRRIFGKKK